MNEKLVSFIESNDKVLSYLKELHALNIILSNEQFKWLALAELVSADANSTKQDIMKSLERVKFINKNIDLLNLSDGKKIKEYLGEIRKTLNKDLEKFIKRRTKK